MAFSDVNAVGQCFMHSKGQAAEIKMAKVLLEWKSGQVPTVYGCIVQEYRIFTELMEWKGKQWHERISAIPEPILSLH